ncbi:hypothetical protein FRC07_006960 [Ceratobasidium sp. 392]|nr:hypothetical protein FRC07_006960 [Ceratobasidium sp. 392]
MMTEDEAANGIYSCLITTLKDSKNDGLLDNSDWVSGEEERLVVCGLELLFLYVAWSETASPSILLPCPEDNGRRLDSSTCPTGLRPYFDRWAGLVPRLQPLFEDHVQDLALLICKKPPITLPKDVPDPFPFSPTPEQSARREIRDLQSELLTISDALSAHASLVSLWKGKLWRVLSEVNDASSSNQIPNVITSNMTVSEVIAVLGRHHCLNVSHQLDLASCSERPVNYGGLNEVYKGRLRDGTLVAVRLSRRSISDEDREGKQTSVSPHKPPSMHDPHPAFVQYTARELHTWSQCHHPNVQPLVGLAQFRGGIATISSWMENGDIREYVNRHPGADRFNLEIMSGEQPYSDIGFTPRVLTAVLNDRRLPARPLKQIPLNDSQSDMLWTLLTKCWQYEPDQRPTAEQVYKHVASEIIAHLGSRKCPDLSDQLDLSLCSQDPLTSGGYGEVYRGALKSGQQVALKSMIVVMGSSRSEKELLKLQQDTARELYTWSKFNHPNVIKLLGLAMFRNRVAMVSPWMNNGNLMSCIKRNAGADRCQLCSQVAEGLTYLHRIDMVSTPGILLPDLNEVLFHQIHADVKAANVLVSDQGVAMLTDFGNSILTLSTLRFAGTDTGRGMSLRWTQAPEILLDEGKHSQEADVYALAMTILEALTGNVPHPELKNDATFLTAVVVWKQSPKRPECIPSNSYHGDKLWALLTQCWSRERTQRPPAALVRDMMKTITTDGLLPYA